MNHSLLAFNLNFDFLDFLDFLTFGGAFARIHGRIEVRAVIILARYHTIFSRRYPALRLFS